MKLHFLNPNLMVQDVQASVEYYQAYLGFHLVQKTTQEDAAQWAIVKSGEIVMMFHERASLTHEYPSLEETTIGASMTLYIQGEGIREFYEKVQQQPVQIIKPIQETDYNTIEFAIQDLNGYILDFAEVIS